MTSELDRLKNLLAQKEEEINSLKDELNFHIKNNELILENSSDGYVVQDKDGRIIKYNPAAMEILGRPHDELLKRDSRDPAWKTVKPDGTVFKPEDYPVNIVLQTGTPVKDVIMGVHNPKSGLHWLKICSFPIKKNQGSNEKFALTTFVDITKEINQSNLNKIAEENLIKSENKLKHLYKQAQDAIMTLEPPEWKFTAGNPATLKLFNIGTETEFIQLGPWNVSPEIQPDGIPSAEKAKQMIMGAMEKGVQFFDWTHQTIDGKLIPCTVKLSRIQENDHVYLHALVRDISAEKKLEEQLIEAKEFLTFAMEGAGLGIWDWNLITNEVTFDRRWTEMLGLDVNEIKHELNTWQELVHPDDLAKCFEDIKNYTEGKTDRYENIHRMKHADGRWVYILDQGRFSAWNSEGEPVRFTGTHLDITESQESHRQRIEEFNEILSSTPSILKVLDREGRLLEISRQGLDILEIETFQSIKGFNFIEMVDDDHKTAYLEFHQGICDGHKGSFSYQLVSKTGKKIWLESYAAPYRLPSGELGHIAISNDITLKKTTEQELKKERAYAQHQSKLASLGELAAGVGHEINNPLTIIRGKIEALMGKPELLSKEVIESLSKMEHATDRVAKIVLGLRNFSR